MNSTSLSENLVQRANVADILRRSAAQYGDKVALVSGAESVTFVQLNTDVNRVSRALLARGVARGDAVAMIFKNSIDFFSVYFACARIGAMAVPINPQLRTPDYQYILEQTRARLLVVHPALVDTAVSIQSFAEELQVIVAGEVPAWNVPGADAGRWSTWTEFTGEPGDCELPYRNDVETFVDDRDGVQCIFTSGTTATAKGAVASHMAVIFSAINVMHHQRLSSRDVALALFPNHHVAGLNNSVIPYLMVGATTVLLDGWDAQTVASVLTEHRITMLILTGPMTIEVFAHHGPEHDWSALRLIVLGISSLPHERAEDVRRVCPGIDLLLASGQTEFTGYEEGMLPEHQVTKPGSWGNPTLVTDIVILDDQDKILEVGVIGEIAYRGPQAMTHYLGEPDLTAQSFKNGWFHSGDLGFIDADGTIHFVDRKKDMIKSGGENVASIEVIQTIMRHDAVAECAVVGLPHPRWTEAVTAFVIKRPGVDSDELAILDHCRAELAAFKVPKRIIFVDDIPRTASRKVRNVELRNEYQDLYR